MKPEIKKLLKKKHLLIVGKSEIERHIFITNLIVEMNLETFRFPVQMKGHDDDYFSFIKKNKLYKPWYEVKKYTKDQILDFHRDWIAETNSLLVMEELDFMEAESKRSILKEFINVSELRKNGKEKVKLIISQETENGLFNALSEFFQHRKFEKRTALQIVE